MDRRVGLTHEDIHSHSLRPFQAHERVWISRISAVEGIGFPARREEVRRFGFHARRVRRIGAPSPPLQRSFAHVVAEGSMADRPWKRRGGHEDWMEEDDLLGGELRQEQDLQHKLQRGARSSSGNGGRCYDPQPDRSFECRDRYEQQWKGGKGAPAPSYQGGKRNYNRTRKEPIPQEIRREPAKAKVPWQDPKSKGPIVCFRCREEGHHQLDCTNDPICYKCKKSGHMAVECGSVHKNKINMFGFGIPEQGFYSITIPEAKIKT